MTTIWVGPVNLAQVKADPLALNVECCGALDPACPPLTCGALAESWVDADGRRLPNMLRSRGASPAEDVLLGAFSAGGVIAKRLCLHPADRAQIRVLYSADADYESEQASNGGPIFTEGYVRFALDALDGSKLFVATASANPNKSFGTGIDVLRATRLEIERRSGRRFENGGGFPVDVSQPARLWRLGGVWFAEYPDVPHGQHATMLAPALWRAMVLPWLAKAPLPAPEGVPQDVAEKPFWPDLLALATGTLLGWGVVRVWRRRR